MSRSFRPLLAVLSAFSGVMPMCVSGEPMKFDFGSARAADGFTVVDGESVFSVGKGYGFESGLKPEVVDRGGDALRGDFLTAEGGFYFSVVLPEGNYRVSLLLGDPAGESSTTVKAESRRLILENVETEHGKQVVRKFAVNIRRPEIDASNRVGLKEREKNYLHWDDRLTLEFNGARPCVAAVEIIRVEDAATVFLIGDSTVTDQPNEPWNSWGQMLPRFFDEKVAVANHAESGESLRSSLNARRVAKVESVMKKGDYLFIQFGHNDMKDASEGALERYEKNLTELVRRVRKTGVTPVLVTSMERKNGLRAGGNTLQGYPEAVRRVAKAEKTALIDLQAASLKLYAALGKDLDLAFQDGTHHNNYGSYQLAKCVAAGIRAAGLPLAAHLTDGAGDFDPSKPDDASTFEVAASPVVDLTKPDGD